MSKPFTDLRYRVRMLEQANRVPRPIGRDVHDEARIERLRKQVERLERVAATPARLGTIVANQSVVTHGTFSFSGSYSTGGEPFPFAGLPGASVVMMAGQQGVTFKYDNAKMLAYDSSGSEYAATTDLSVLVDVPYIAIGQVDSERLAFHAREEMLVHEVQVQVGSTFTLDNSDYWTLTLVRRTAAGVREELGDPLSLQSRSLAANSLVTMYLPDEPLRLNDSDTIHVEIVETGSPDYLSDLVVWVDARRRTA